MVIKFVAAQLKTGAEQFLQLLDAVSANVQTAATLWALRPERCEHETSSRPERLANYVDIFITIGRFSEEVEDCAVVTKCVLSRGLELRHI